MIPWTKIDNRLAAIGKDRAWLAANTPYSAGTIRTAMAPNSTKRTLRMQEVLSRAIEDEENRRHEPREVRPGVFEIFQTEEELDRADRASRVAGSDSLVNFCREVIFDAADHLLKQEAAAGIQQGQSAEDTRLDPDPAADPEKNGESAA